MLRAKWEKKTKLMGHSQGDINSSFSRKVLVFSCCPDLIINDDIPLPLPEELQFQ